MKKKKPTLKNRWVQIIRYEDNKDWEEKQVGFYSPEYIGVNLSSIWRFLKKVFSKKND